MIRLLIILGLGLATASGQSTFEHLQAAPGWQSCSPCAGLNGHGPNAEWRMTQHERFPSESGDATQFAIAGPHPFADVIWWKQLGPNSGVAWQYDVDFYLTQPQSSQALEFDVNQNIDGKRFIFGTQCDIEFDGQWDVWDTLANRWRPTGISCHAPSAFRWHHLTWIFNRNSSVVHYIAFALDGQWHYVNRVYLAKPSGGEGLNVAFQMDGDYAQHPYSVWLDNVSLKTW